MTPLFPINRLYAQLVTLVEGRLWARVLVGLVLGICVGTLLGPAVGVVPAEHVGTATGWLALPGDLFLRLVQMIMIPLVVASIIQGIAGEGKRDGLARLGAQVGVYFLVTTLVAVVLGLVAALLIRPGSHGLLSATVPPAPVTSATDLRALDLPSLISGLLPTNPLASMLAGEMLSVVIFAAIMGAALVAMEREHADPMLRLLFSVQEICMTVTRWAMALAPFAVFGLMTRTVAASGLSVIMGLGMYVLTVVLVLVVVLALYVAVIALATPVSIARFFSAAKDVLLLAFSVASSAAVMPLTMKTAEESLAVPQEVARFVVPVGAIMNMNGTAAYQAVATVFLAQTYGFEIAVPTLVLVVVTTVAASIGTPSAPGAGIVVLATVLASAGIPSEGIALIVGVDHLLGMCRTAVNVAGDLTACVVFSRRRTEPLAVSEAAGLG